MKKKGNRMKKEERIALSGIRTHVPLSLVRCDDHHSTAHSSTAQES